MHIQFLRNRSFVIFSLFCAISVGSGAVRASDNKDKESQKSKSGSSMGAKPLDNVISRLAAKDQHSKLTETDHRSIGDFLDKLAKTDFADLKLDPDLSMKSLVTTMSDLSNLAIKAKYEKSSLRLENKEEFFDFWTTSVAQLLPERVSPQENLNRPTLLMNLMAANTKSLHLAWPKIKLQSALLDQWKVAVESPHFKWLPLITVDFPGHIGALVKTVKDAQEGFENISQKRRLSRSEKKKVADLQNFMKILGPWTRGILTRWAKEMDLVLDTQVLQFLPGAENSLRNALYQAQFLNLVFPNCIPFDLITKMGGGFQEEKEESPKTSSDEESLLDQLAKKTTQLTQEEATQLQTVLESFPRTNLDHLRRNPFKFLAVMPNVIYNLSAIKGRDTLNLLPGSVLQDTYTFWNSIMVTLMSLDLKDPGKSQHEPLGLVLSRLIDVFLEGYKTFATPADFEKEKKFLEAWRGLYAQWNTHLTQDEMAQFPVNFQTLAVISSQLRASNSSFDSESPSKESDFVTFLSDWCSGVLSLWTDTVIPVLQSKPDLIPKVTDHLNRIDLYEPAYVPASIREFLRNARQEQETAASDAATAPKPPAKPPAPPKEEKRTLKDIAQKAENHELDIADVKAVQDYVTGFVKSPFAVKSKEPRKHLHQSAKLIDFLLPILNKRENHKKIQMPENFFEAWISSTSTLLGGIWEKQEDHLDPCGVLDNVMLANIKLLQLQRLAGNFSKAIYSKETELLTQWQSTLSASEICWTKERIASLPSTISGVAQIFTNMRKTLSSESASALTTAKLRDIDEFWPYLSSWYAIALNTWRRKAADLVPAGFPNLRDIENIAGMLITLKNAFDQCLGDVKFWEEFATAFRNQVGMNHALDEEIQSIINRLKKQAEVKSRPAHAETKTTGPSKVSDFTLNEIVSTLKQLSIAYRQKTLSKPPERESNFMNEARVKLARAFLRQEFLNEDDFKETVNNLAILSEAQQSKESSNSVSLSSATSESKEKSSSKTKKKSSIDRLNALLTPQEIMDQCEDALSPQTDKARRTEYLKSITRDILRRKDQMPKLLRVWSEASKKFAFAIEKPWIDQWCSWAKDGFPKLDTGDLTQIWLLLTSLKLDRKLPVFDQLQELLAERLTDEIDLQQLEGLLLSFVKAQSKGELPARADLRAKLQQIVASKSAKEQLKDSRKKLFQETLERLDPPKPSVAPVVPQTTVPLSTSSANASVSTTSAPVTHVSLAPPLSGTVVGPRLNTSSSLTSQASMTSDGKSKELASVPSSPAWIALLDEGIAALNETPPNYEKAKDRFTQAASHGSIEASIRLAELYRDGKGMKQEKPNYKRAERQYQRVLKQIQDDPHPENFVYDDLRGKVLINYLVQSQDLMKMLENGQCNSGSKTASVSAPPTASAPDTEHKQTPVSSSIRTPVQLEAPTSYTSNMYNAQNHPQDLPQDSPTMREPFINLSTIFEQVAAPIRLARQKEKAEHDKLKQILEETREEKSKDDPYDQITSRERQELEARQKSLAEIIHDHPEWKNIIDPRDILSRMETTPTPKVLDRMLGLGHLNNYFIYRAIPTVPTEIIEYYLSETEILSPFAPQQIPMLAFIKALKHLKEAALGNTSGDPIAQYVLAQIYEGSYPGGPLPVPYSPNNADFALELFRDAAKREYGELEEQNHFIALANFRMGEKMTALGSTKKADKFFAKASIYVGVNNKHSARFYHIAEGPPK